MIEIYGINIKNEIDRDRFSYLLNFISKEKQEKIGKYKFANDAKRCLLGELLVRYTIYRRFGIKNYQLKFHYNEYGKPCILEPKDIHFNISHSGDWVVCAIDNKPIGIDVETIKPIDLNIARRFFTVEEYNDLMKKDEYNKIRYFCMLWTLKESYIKAIGKGFEIPLNSFSFTIKNGNVNINTQNEFGPCFFYQKEIDNNHIISVCALNKEFMPDIEVIKMSQLLLIFCEPTKINL